MSATDAGFIAALEEAKKGANEGGVPIGSCLVSAEGKILGRGHNMRMQQDSPTIHVRSRKKKTKKNLANRRLCTSRYTV
jgi:tRNA(Arg) A34 adenosine deaminase TadA